jgi:hypothetical protein
MSNTVIDINLKVKSNPTVNITTVDNGTLSGAALIAPTITVVATGTIGVAGPQGIPGETDVQDGSISTAKIANDAITSDKILNFTIATNDIGAQQITSAKLGTNSVTTIKITNDAVTGDKIANNAIGAEHIQAGTITKELISDGTLQGDKIEDFTITEGKIANNSLSTIKYQSRSVTGDKISSNADLDGEVKAHNLKLKGSSPATLTGPDSDALQIKSNTTLDFKSTSDSTIASLDQSGNLTLSGTVDGRDIAVDGAKLDTISANDAIDWTTDQGGINIHAGNYTDTNTTYSEATNVAEGLMSIAHHDKLDGIETSADVTDAANVTAAGALMDSELTDLAGVKGVTISTLQVKPSEGAFADGDKTKLDAIEASADVTDATNVTAAGALMDSEVTNLAEVKAFSSGDYATAAQGTTADSAQQPPTEGAFVDGDKTKLDGIATGAEVNVQSDWNSSSGDNQILNKPTIPAAYADADAVSAVAAADDYLKNNVNEILTGNLTIDSEVYLVNISGDSSKTRIRNTSTTGNKTIEVPDASGTMALTNAHHHFIHAGWFMSYPYSRYVPLNGSITEQTTSTNAPEYTTFIWPYDGYVKTIWLRSETDMGSTEVKLYKGANGSSVGTAMGAVTETVGVNTSVEFTITGVTNSYSQGEAMAIRVDPTEDPDGGQNITMELVFDLTT